MVVNTQDYLDSGTTDFINRNKIFLSFDINSEIIESYIEIQMRYKKLINLQYLQTEQNYISYLQTEQKKALVVTSATRQVRQQWFSVCIFPLRLLFGLTGNRPQSAPACSFLRYGQLWLRCESSCKFDKKVVYVV